MLENSSIKIDEKFVIYQRPFAPGFAFKTATMKSRGPRPAAVFLKFNHEKVENRKWNEDRNWSEERNCNEELRWNEDRNWSEGKNCNEERNCDEKLRWNEERNWSEDRNLNEGRNWNEERNCNQERRWNEDRSWNEFLMERYFQHQIDSSMTGTGTGTGVTFHDDCIEVIELTSDSYARDGGIGIGIAGNRTMGVYIKAIHGGSPAQKNGRVRVGDQLLQIDEVDLAGMTTDQVARVIRFHHHVNGIVRLVVAHQQDHQFKQNMCRRKSSQAANQFKNSLRPSCSEQVVKILATPEAKTNRPNDLSVRVDIENDGPSKLIRSKTEDSLGIPYKTVSSTKILGQPLKPSSKRNPSTETKFTLISSQSAEEIEGIEGIQETSKTIEGIQETSGIIKSDPSDDDEEFQTNYLPDVNPPNFPTMRLFKKTSSRKVKREETKNVEEMPLVSFDQFSDSPTASQILRCNSEDSTKSRESQEKKFNSSSTKSQKSSAESHKISWNCPVCLDGASRIRRTRRRLMSTACGHVFCDKCLRDILRNHKLCPSCRTKIQEADVHPIFM